jgi:hypothetical protein
MICPPTLTGNTVHVWCFQAKASFLQPDKDDLRLKRLGIYSILYKSGRVYIEQIRHSSKTKIQKHCWHIWLLSFREISCVQAEHKVGSPIQFHYTNNLTKISEGEEGEGKGEDRIGPIRVSIEMLLHSAMNREESFSLTRSWKHLI